MRQHTPLSVPHKQGFSMITAVMTIIIMAAITSMIMGVTGKTIKATTAQYRKEQAALLARSYTELAVLYAIHYDRNSTNGCLETINSNFGDVTSNDSLYTVTTRIRYIGNDTLLQNCATSSLIARWLTGDNNGFDATLSLIIDVYVKYKELDDPSNRDITFHRRTVQKL